MTLSLDETVLAVRRHFRDFAWSNHTIKEWIKDAVRDYSIHFPIIATIEDDAEDDVYEYDFFAGAHDEEDLPVIFGVIEFEYPAGEDPPEYPKRGSHTQSSFFGDGVSYYDVVLNPAMNNVEIWLSQPETGQKFQAKYLAEHTWTSVDSGGDQNCEVPSHHRPIIVQYVILQCWLERLTMSLEEVDLKHFNVLEKRVAFESLRYETMLEQAKRTRPSESKTIPWAMDAYDRIY